MMLCVKCYRKTEIAYNELCYLCYKKLGRVPLRRNAKKGPIIEHAVVEPVISKPVDRVIAAANMQ